MTVIATADVHLARKLGEAITGRKSYILSASDEKELRHLVHSSQPEVLVLDVRLGGNRYRAMAEVPRLMLTRSHPAVILLIPWRSTAVREEAGRMGCYEVVVIGRPSFLRQLSQAVIEAADARLAGALEPPRRGHGSLH